MTLQAAASGQSGIGYVVHLRAGRHELVADMPESTGGADTGPPPLGFVLSGLAACTAITLRMYAQRHGWQLDDLRVDVRTVDTNGERRVERMLTFAREQPREQRARLAEIAEKTPVTLLLRSGIPIDTTVAAD